MNCYELEFRLKDLFMFAFIGFILGFGSNSP